MINSDALYLRQMSLKEVGKIGQQKLRDSKVLMVGAGGLGCPTLMYLTAAGVGKIHIIDGDQVETSNLHRQILFTPKDVGQNKAQVATKKIKEMAPLCEVEYTPQFLTKENIDLLGPFDFVVEGCDNFKTKFLVHDYCQSHGIDLVAASIHKFDGTLYHFPFSKTKDSACLRCLWPEEPEKGCVGTCSEVGVLGVVPGFFGTLMASEVIKGILELDPLDAGTSFSFDLRSMEKQKIKWPKDPSCPQCGTGAKEMENPIELPFSEIENPEEYLWVDIRNPFEWVEGFEDSFPFKSFKQIPMNNILENLNNLVEEKKVIIFCAHGVRSFQVVQYLHAQGHKQFISLQEGVAPLRQLKKD